MGRAGNRDEMLEVLIVGLGGVGSKGLICGSIRQLTVDFSKVIFLV